MYSLNQMLPRTKNNSALTLIELLTIIVIVAVVIALLFPVAKNVLYQGKAAGCLGNMRNYGQSLFVYIADHGGLPDVAPGVNPNFRSRLVKEGYLDRLPHCPGNPGGYKGTYAGSAGLCHYYPKLQGIRAPMSRVILAAENFYGDSFAHGMHFNTTMWGTPASTTVPRESFEEREGEVRKPQYHGTKTIRGLHAIFLDGSAKLLFPENSDWNKLGNSDKNPDGYWFSDGQFKNMKEGRAAHPGY